MFEPIEGRKYPDCVVSEVGVYVPGVIIEPPEDGTWTDVDPWDGGEFEPPQEPPWDPPWFPDATKPSISFPNFSIRLGDEPYRVLVEDVNMGTSLTLGNTYTTSARFVNVSPDHSNTAGISEQELVVTGQLNEALVREGLGTIKAYLKSMNIPGRLYYEILLPSSPEALTFYNRNRNLLSSISMSGEYEIVSFATLRNSTQEILIGRFMGSFLVKGEILMSGGDLLLTQEDTKTGNGAFSKSPVRQGYKNYQAIRPIPLSNVEEAERRELVIYDNGILNSEYSFNSSIIPTPFLDIPHKYRSIFKSEVDSTVDRLVKINNLEVPLSDYPYNAITDSKVSESLNEELLEALNSSYDLRGVSLASTVVKSIKKSLLVDELDSYTLDDLITLSKDTRVTEPLSASPNQSENNKEAYDLMINQGISLDPLATDNIILKNQLFNWKILAEDIDKRIIFKTADQVETPIYIPNSEKITTVTSNGTEHSLEMQDGDFFVADPVVGDKRLTVFSDRDKAIMYNPKVDGKLQRLLNIKKSYTLDASSDTSGFTEYNVDTSTPRQDYYFLKLNKDTIKDEPCDSFVLQKTSATYEYITTGIDEYVKHKAFPGLIVTLNSDDMFFNHLEASNKAQLNHLDFTFKYFSNNISQIIVRTFPQHILILPTDTLSNNITQERATLYNFNTRRAKISRTPFNRGKYTLSNPFYVTPEYDMHDVVNFTDDRTNNTIWQQKLKYTFNLDAVTSYSKYLSGAEVLPRKKKPFGAWLSEINNLKTVYNLSDRDTLQSYDLYTRLTPANFKGLRYDVDYTYPVKSNLRLGQPTPDKEFNKNTFVKIKEATLAGTPTLLPSNDDAPTVFIKQKVPAGPVMGEPVPTPTPAPSPAIPAPPSPGTY